MTRKSLVLVFGFFALVVPTLVGCSSGENTVVQPTENYEMTEQEKANSEKEKSMMEEQRQQ